MRSFDSIARLELNKGLYRISVMQIPIHNRLNRLKRVLASLEH
jgi:hypothetical protein